ncbi:MAG: hypothetical protein KDA80_14760 [Planctomycetaceae bacterium]|nr:hypothetical protein [Planctomycetaceae bacterium]
MHSLPTPPAKEEGELLVQTADGKGVPLVREDAFKLKSFEDKPSRPGNRRMATLACVYSVDRFARSAEEIVAALFRERRERSEEVPKRPEPCHKRLIACFSQMIEETGETEPISAGRSNGACKMRRVNWDSRTSGYGAIPR